MTTISESGAYGLIGPSPGLCLCMIVGRHNADPISGYPSDVNYAAAFTYDISVQTPSGPPVSFNGVVPGIERWPRPWLVKAFALASSNEETGMLNELLPGAVMGGRFYLLVREERWAAPCGWTPAPSTPNPSGDFPAPPPLRVPPLPGIIPTTPPYPGAIP